MQEVVSLTTEMCTKGCFTARYLFIFITNKWISEMPTRQLITSLKTKSGHTLLRTHWVRLLSTMRLTWENQWWLAERSWSRHLVFYGERCSWLCSKWEQFEQHLRAVAAYRPRKRTLGFRGELLGLSSWPLFVPVWSVVRDRSVWILMQLL